MSEEFRREGEAGRKKREARREKEIVL